MARSTAARWFGSKFGRGRRKSRLRVERLEDRTVPTVLSTQLLFENFDGSDFDGFSTNWSSVQGATHDVFLRLNRPSPSYAIRLDAHPSGGDVLTSRAVDLSAEAKVTLSYFYERKGGGAATAAGDDLLVEARDSSGNWVEIDRQLGSGPAMTQFQQQKIALAPAFLYDGFQFRIRRVGTGGDWFIDDVKLAAATGYQNYWSTQSRDTGLSYPNVLSFTFPNTPPPAGGGSLTITAVGDLGDAYRYLSLSAEGQALGDVFVNDGRSFSTVTATLPLSRSVLQALAADGTIQLSVTPSQFVFASPNTFTPISVR